ncbi:MAG: ABC transporter permease [Pseudomonadota bacterium]|nr:ABC transporter permease [Pseudomonadota bacterium]
MQLPNFSNKEWNWLGLRTLYLREVRRFTKVYIQTILAPVITTLVFLVIFTLAIGELRGGTINGVPFAEYLAPGLIMMAIIQNSFANASSSIMAAKMQGNIIDTLMPPLSPTELTFAYASGGATRGITVGLAVSIAMSLSVDLKIENVLCIVFFAILASFMLAMLGIIGGIWADRQDHMTVMNGFIITPLSFLSGTFYSIDRLPQTLQYFALANPFFYAIDGLRAGFIGFSDGSLVTGGLVLIITNMCLWVLCRQMFATGYKLKA